MVRHVLDLSGVHGHGDGVLASSEREARAGVQGHRRVRGVAVVGAVEPGRVRLGPLLTVGEVGGVEEAVPRVAGGHAVCEAGVSGNGEVSVGMDRPIEPILGDEVDWGSRCGELAVCEEDEAGEGLQLQDGFHSALGSFAGANRGHAPELLASGRVVGGRHRRHGVGLLVGIQGQRTAPGGPGVVAGQLIHGSGNPGPGGVERPSAGVVLPGAARVQGGQAQGAKAHQAEDEDQEEGEGEDESPGSDFPHGPSLRSREGGEGQTLPLPLLPGRLSLSALVYLDHAHIVYSSYSGASRVYVWILARQEVGLLHLGV